MRTRWIGSVLAATDAAEAGDEVVRAAGALARAAGAELHVVHALELELGAYPEVNPAEFGFQARIARAEEALDLQLARTLPPGVRAASRQVVVSMAHRAILDRAGRVAADVIVLGPHRGGAPPGLLGATADRVIRSAACPCLVVRGPLALPLRRVVVPLDLSDPARGALTTALGWIEALGGRDAADPVPLPELDVVHVVPALFATDELPVNRAAIGPRLHAQVEQALDEHRLEVVAREELVWGDGPAREIARYAAEQEAGLVVLATHGHGAVKRALVGSVASAVARTAPCPVLLVPPSRWALREVEPALEGAAAAA
ncbi:MAG TPA: universal stress protein [Longimicrobium sp.]|nr:universal stress protein [Longimicrobium sp.]